MNLSIIIATFFGVLYFIILSAFFFAMIFKSSKYKIVSGEPDIVYISVIIPVRNEAENLPKLFKGLKNQNIDKNLFEVIFVNDHSQDNSLEILINLSENINNFKVISLQNAEGKKNALREGINISKGNLCVTTDADCRHQSDWLSIIYNFYKFRKPKMIIGPVKIVTKNYIEKFQEIEFDILTAVTAGSASIKQPVLCSGANLSFEKSVYLENIKNYSENFQSGDDMFLLHKVKKKYRDKIHFLYDKKAVVYAQSHSKLSDFLSQRKRWVSKAKGYKDFGTSALAFITTIVNILITAAYVLASLNYINLMQLIVFSGFSFLPEIFLLYKISGLFRTRNNIILYSVYKIFYPFYLLILIISILFSDKYNWKNRKLR